MTSLYPLYFKSTFNHCMITSYRKNEFQEQFSKPRLRISLILKLFTNQQQIFLSINREGDINLICAKELNFVSSIPAEAKAVDLAFEHFRIFSDELSSFQSLNSIKIQHLQIWIFWIFGHPRGSFLRLQNVPFPDSTQVCKIIQSACILHNLCINDEVEDYPQFGLSLD